jgi:hypothetical protein
MIQKGKTIIDKRTIRLLFIIIVIAWMTGSSGAKAGYGFDGNSASVDIGIFNTGCSNFEVSAKPLIDLTGTSVTNVQFTVRWPGSTVNLVNLISAYNLAQQGPVYQSGGFNYAIFSSATPIPVNWTTGTEYVLLSFSHDQSGSGYADFSISDDAWTIANNGLYYLELLGMDNTGIIYHQVQNAYLSGCGKVDIGIFNTGCGDFEVRAKPLSGLTGTSLTNIQFTVRWPGSTVNLVNFISAYNLAQQGPVYQSGGFNYAIFSSATPIPISWTAGIEYVLLSFSHDQSGTGYADFLISDDDWTLGNNGAYYLELLGLDYTGIVYHSTENTYLSKCGVVDVRVLLQGPYNVISGRMNSTVNLYGNIPLSQTFNMAPWNYPGTEQVTELPDSIVDWVLVELRDKVNNTLTIERRAGLLSKCGVVMETDLTTGLHFTAAESFGDFYIVVWHRNHMPVMSGLPVAVPNFREPYDFTQVATTQPYKHNDPLPAELEVDPGSGRYAMIAGDINANKELSYLGPENDRSLILARIAQVSGLDYLNTIISGYYNEDITLDNNVIYLGSPSDRYLILSNLLRLTGSANLNAIYHSVVP